jgi:hypothetical protein
LTHLKAYFETRISHFMYVVMKTSLSGAKVETRRLSSCVSNWIRERVQPPPHLAACRCAAASAAASAAHSATSASTRWRAFNDVRRAFERLALSLACLHARSDSASASASRRSAASARRAASSALRSASILAVISICSRDTTSLTASRADRFVALQVAFERRILKPVFHLIGYRLWV